MYSIPLEILSSFYSMIFDNAEKQIEAINIKFLLFSKGKYLFNSTIQMKKEI